jgi:L-ascorbate metabolism protein UlaG (beta-lactamase superfamily)
MHVEWYGQSAFRLTGNRATVIIDPFGDVSGLAARGIQFDYPPIPRVDADVVLVTHEHVDHNGVEAIGGSPTVLRSTAGRLESPIGEVVAVASEHDRAAGTERGPNSIFVFELDGIRISHFGDFGQTSLRPEQAIAIGAVDLLLIPVGGGPTIGASEAAQIAGQIMPRWVVPMHYRTPRIGFLEPVNGFLERMPRVHRLEASTFDTTQLSATNETVVVVPGVPG